MSAWYPIAEINVFNLIIVTDRKPFSTKYLKLCDGHTILGINGDHNRGFNPQIQEVRKLAPNHEKYVDTTYQ